MTDRELLQALADRLGNFTVTEVASVPTDPVPGSPPVDEQGAYDFTDVVEDAIQDAISEFVVSEADFVRFPRFWQSTGNNPDLFQALQNPSSERFDPWFTRAFLHSSAFPFTIDPETGEERPYVDQFGVEVGLVKGGNPATFPRKIRKALGHYAYTQSGGRLR